ncbi:branched-chain amino acid aminotransferase [Thalassoroseus pseudoceratinae]|uniref:branched-chain amino acid aminotransferase n=1 Tax=Thalassoroseus pseudoceratinae TaxID=2713176 RepID=UPI00141F625A|nr:branched-chain amino acid aminotransferase [Thalassoroseus pseudoceratinae]
MTNLATALLNDEAGFIVSAELILIATILVLGLVVGLSEIANSVNGELNDVGAAIGSVNQSYSFSGFTGCKGQLVGSKFRDHRDEGDSQHDISCDFGPRPEAPKGSGKNY